MEQERWFGVELRHLAALAAVAREGSFRGAADSLGYVQSAISQQVANLERIVGARLVERFRGSKTIYLTAEGELLVAHAEEILARVRAARSDLAAQASGHDRGTVRVAVSQSVAVGLLPAVIRHLAATAPGVRVVPVEAAGEDALAALVESAQVDLALGDLPAGSDSFESSIVMHDPCALIVAAGRDVVEDGRAPTLEQLARLPLVRLAGWRFTSILEAWMAANGLTLDFVLTADSAATARGFVAAGLGAAIVPSLGVDTLDPRTTVIELGDAFPSRPVAVYWNAVRQRRRTFDAFREAAAAAARDLSGERQAVPPLIAVDQPLAA